LIYGVKEMPVDEMTPFFIKHSTTYQILSSCHQKMKKMADYMKDFGSKN
jgi:hypothetical protein